MKIKILLFFSSIITLFQACAPEPLEIVVPPIESKVVVFSQIIPDALMAVALTRSFGALDFNEDEGDTVTTDFLDQLLVSGATVTVSYRDIRDTLYETGNGSGVYVSLGTLAYVNETYTLNITTQEGEQLTAASKMLPRVKFDDIIPVIERTAEDTLVTVEYRFTDPPEDNWYVLNFYTNGDAQENGIDLNSFFSSGSDLLKKSLLLRDDVFENRVHEGRVELSNVSPTDSLVVTISNISADYYQFLELRKTSSNFFTELTKEPVNYPTNVENGLGFFNTHFPDLVFFDLNEF